MNINLASRSLTLIANTGVLIGLILLVIELNQNSNIAHINSFQNLIAQVNHVAELQVTDPVLTELIIRGNADEPLTEIEMSQYKSFWTLNINSGRLAHKQYDSGLINEREMRGLLGPVRVFLTPEIGQQIWRKESENYSTRFRIYVTAMMAEILPDNEYWEEANNRMSLSQ